MNVQKGAGESSYTVNTMFFFQKFNVSRGKFTTELFSNYFDTIHFDIHAYNTRNNENPFTDKIKFDITNRAFYYKGELLLMCNYTIFNNFGF